MGNSALRIHDVVVQTQNGGLWWMQGPFEGDLDDYDYDGSALEGVCIQDSNCEGWSVGDTCPFAIDPLDEGVMIIGHVEEHDTALAIASLVGADGFC